MKRDMISVPLPMPYVKEDMVTIQINEDGYVVGIENCKLQLHNKIVLNKEDKPSTYLKFCLKILKSWTFFGSWKSIPLGNGFYEFKF